ncbi:MAG: hypothetical protein JXP36_03615 [Bacteroidales bacterium]|nr:hypothetical protein [Bacteroidales bacterium]
MISLSCYYTCTKDNIGDDNDTVDNETSTMTKYYLSFEVNYFTEDGTRYPIVCDVSVFNQGSKKRLERGVVISGWYVNPLKSYTYDDEIRIELWNQTDYCFDYKVNISPATTPKFFVTSKDNLKKNKQALPHFYIPKSELHNQMYGAWGP